MGSAVRILNSSAEHIRAQSQIDAARTKQKAHNDAQISLAESKKIVQTANNAASTLFANSQRALQSTNNDVSAKIVAAQKGMQVTYNDQIVQVTAAKRVLQAARNERAAADSDVAKWSQSIGNNKVLDATGRQINNISEEIALNLDKATTGRAFDRLAYSGALGASIAGAAAAGVGGGSVEAHNTAMRMQQNFKEAAEDRAIQRNTYLAGQAKGNALRAGVDSLKNDLFIADMDREDLVAAVDTSAIFDNQDFTAIQDQQDYTVYSPDLDYTVYMDHKKMSGFQQVATFVGAAAATWFAGPLAGMAVVNGSMALNDMQNGDMASAQRGFDSAAQGISGGFKTWRAGADQNTSGASWGSQIMSKSSNSGANLKVGKG